MNTESLTRFHSCQRHLLAMSNHLAAMHPALGGSEGGGGGSKSTAAIPMLEEGITETAWAAWRARFDRWAVACKLSDKKIENRVFECIPNSLADQISRLQKEICLFIS